MFVLPVNSCCDILEEAPAVLILIYIYIYHCMEYKNKKTEIYKMKFKRRIILK